MVWAAKGVLEPLRNIGEQMFVAIQVWNYNRYAAFVYRFLAVLRRVLQAVNEASERRRVRLIGGLDLSQGLIDEIAAFPMRQRSRRPYSFSERRGRWLAQQERVELRR